MTLRMRQLLCRLVCTSCSRFRFAAIRPSLLLHFLHWSQICNGRDKEIRLVIMQIQYRENLNSLWQHMLISVPILMLHLWNDNLFPLKRTIVDSRQTFQWFFLILGQKHDEAKRIARVGQETVDVLQWSIDKLFRVGWIRLKRASSGKEFQECSEKNLEQLRLACR